ncbi:S41 family peptidase [Alkalimonas delamerensis]|uniref:Tricorn protease homolog n=1 Tax=Alkalimonas delamerensis TaxID=265981 RepID=A0ABT9GNX5_9GAMM|nr:S41 family peptidase [Alkalimonas delamerensis]MDP4528657.1 S41 family peptidase [Alkalimonas delamerensis]
MLKKTLLAFAVAAAISPVSLAADGYFRAPSLQQDQLIFTSEGAIWQANLNELRGQRLTTHPSEEIQGRLSPDGNWLAFVASYEQTPEVYVKPAAGGVAKRVTFENSRVRLQGWTADGQLLYSTDQVAGPANFWLLKTVDPTSLQTTTLPVADAIEGVLDPAGEWLYFVQHGLQVTGDNARTYRGGALGELWRYRLGAAEAELLSAEHQGSIRHPMLWQDRLYFVSDQSGNPNIWSTRLDGSDARQLTDHQDWQVRQAYLNQGRIVYQLGADIQLLDLASGEDRLLPLSIQSDRPHQRERWLDQPLNYLTSAHYAGFGDQVVLTARGKVAIAAKSPARLVEIATPSDSRVREAILSHDGRWVYAISDQSGELEIWRYAADGRDDAKQLTSDGSGFRWRLALSPDGNWLAHDDKAGNLWLLNLQTQENRLAYSGGVGLAPFADIVWSHDSELLAVTTIATRQERSQVLLYSLAEQKYQLVTSDKFESFSPSFSPDGQWLYFLSNRHFRATPGHPWGDRNLGPMFDRRSQIFALSLKEDAVFPFQPPTELPAAVIESVETPRRGRRATAPARVDWQGLSERLWQVPVEPGNYQQLTVTESRLFVRDWSYDAGSSPNLNLVKITNRNPKIEQYGAAIADYQVSRDGKQLFLRKHQGNGVGPMYVVDIGDREPADLSDQLLNSRQWQLALEPKDEWRQMFRDAWLMQREFFFDTAMRGLDWQDAKARYLPLVKRVSDRHELDDVLAQMMGELDALHSQVRGGEYPGQRPTPAAASLGARLETSSGGVRIAHIYRTDPDLPAQLGPLAQPGVNARNGDVITHVNGRQVRNQAEVQQLLRNQVGHQVLLDLTRGRERLQAVVVPVNAGRDHQLRYLDWVQHNAAKVAEASERRFGYLHLYAMGPNDIANFAREFYANIDKEGLIIDVRRNRGGNIDSWIIEKLLRRAWAFWQPTQGGAYTNMQQTFRGHLVVLTDQLTYSDGETFAAGVKALELGPLVGMRTAGAGVWLTGRNLLTDRGVARVSETPQFAMDGRYIIEGHGVEPDYTVRNMPVATFRGEDAQLNFAIDYLRGKLQQEPVPALKAEPLRPGPAADIRP